MMGLTWTRQLSVGNIIIDADHKYLIEIVNSARSAIRKTNSLMLAHELERLDNWLCAHLVNEESIAEVVNFEFSKHKLEKQYALSQLKRLRAELASRSALSKNEIESYTVFLGEWMIDGHISTLDMQMKSALQTRDYAFWPDWDGGVNRSAVHSASLYLQS
jgi:hemerythrin